MEEETVRIMGNKFDIRYLHLLNGSYGSSINSCDIEISMFTTYSISLNVNNKLNWSTYGIVEYKWDLVHRMMIYQLIKTHTEDLTEKIYFYLKLIAPSYVFCTDGVPLVKETGRYEMIKGDTPVVEANDNVMYGKLETDPESEKEGVYYINNHVYDKLTIQILRNHKLIKKVEEKIKMCFYGFSDRISTL